MLYIAMYIIMTKNIRIRSENIKKKYFEIARWHEKLEKMLFIRTYTWTVV